MKNHDYLDEYASDSDFLKEVLQKNKMNLDLNYGNDDSLNNSRRISNNSSHIGRINLIQHEKLQLIMNPQKKES
ncbi:hypothetical protein PFDG_05321 [Plasmodium falciparum Dd2]|uniref:Uncharacterized protein n=1 Tax=Plasmodium falciparum (isolate Dd2) TaxID=57267 RepID=A0A0L7MAC9_PLAF4|nr:hypothetical protein PFDG_05321 [Plasmodium falciparum Dd2]